MPRVALEDMADLVLDGKRYVKAVSTRGCVGCAFDDCSSCPDELDPTVEDCRCVGHESHKFIWKEL